MVDAVRGGGGGGAAPLQSVAICKTPEKEEPPPTPDLTWTETHLDHKLEISGIQLTTSGTKKNVLMALLWGKRLNWQRGLVLNRAMKDPSKSVLFSKTGRLFIASAS